MPRETIEVSSTTGSPGIFDGFGDWFGNLFKKKPKSEKEKWSDLMFGGQPMRYYPKPKSKEYQTIVDLLNDAEKWHGYGDTDLESRVWEMIADKAMQYSRDCKRVVEPVNTTRINELEKELKVTDEILNANQLVLNAIPECPAHGSNCVPHALQWIEKMKALHNSDTK